MVATKHEWLRISTRILGFDNRQDFQSKSVILTQLNKGSKSNFLGEVSNNTLKSKG